MKVRLADLSPKDRKAITDGKVGVPTPRLSRSASTSPAAGRGNRWACHVCGAVFTVWAKAERHADTHGGARLELDIERRT